VQVLMTASEYSRLQWWSRSEDALTAVVRLQLHRLVAMTGTMATTV